MTEPAAQFTITLAQLNPTVGDVAGNAAKARAARAQAKADGADLMVLPELFITGYPPEDLVLKPAFQAACRAVVEELARETADGGPAVLIGSPWVEDGKLYNAFALLDEGRIAALRYKANLPNYGVFDEKRLFARGAAAGLSQPDRWTGRTGVRRRLVCAECRFLGGGAVAGFRREHHDVALGPKRSRLALRRADRACGRGRQRRLRGLRARPARLCPQEWISRRAAGRIRRHRFRAVRGDRGRCARPGACSRRDAAVSVHGAGVA